MWRFLANDMFTHIFTFTFLTKYSRVTRGNDIPMQYFSFWKSISNMLGFYLSLQSLVNLLFMNLHQVFGDYSCWPPSNKQSEIYQNMTYNNGSHLTCVENIGLSMCVNVCEKTVGCKVVNYDSYQFRCSLVKEPRLVTVDDMVTAETKDFVVVWNNSTVS